MQKQLFSLLILFLVSCSVDPIKVDVIEMDAMAATASQESSLSQKSSFCDTQDLQVISDGKSCDIFQGFDICEILEIEDRQFIDQIAFEWAPDICNYEKGDQITFKNGDNTTLWTVVARCHFIAKERVFSECNENWEYVTYICQENEVIYVSFVNEIIGIQDTVTLQLQTITNKYQDQTLGDKRNVVGLWQDRAFTNIANFWINHYVGDYYYEQTSQSFNETVTIGGKAYEDVLKYDYYDTFYSDRRRYYMVKGRGILAFEADDKLWIRQ